MFTSPLANKHFDFNAPYIQLPMIYPMTAPAPQVDEAAEGHGDLFFIDIDQEISLWKAACTLLELHHATIGPSTCSSPTTPTETSSSSESSQDKPRTRQRQRPPQQPSMSGAIAKPRWSDEERATLLQAVIEEKELDQLETFDWDSVAQNVRNHTSDSCQQRWHDYLLPILEQFYQPTSPLSTSSQE